MKTTLPLLALFSVSLVAAGPLPIERNNLLAKRTEAVAAAPAANGTAEVM